MADWTLGRSRLPRRGRSLTHNNNTPQTINHCTKHASEHTHTYAQQLTTRPTAENADCRLTTDLKLENWSCCWELVSINLCSNRAARWRDMNELHHFYKSLTHVLIHDAHSSISIFQSGLGSCQYLIYPWFAIREKEIWHYLYGAHVTLIDK